MEQNMDTTTFLVRVPEKSEINLAVTEEGQNIDLRC